MPEIKLTKNELRAQQNRLSQLRKYLPTLQLKKAMLQAEVQEAKQEIARFEAEFNAQQTQVDRLAPLLSAETAVDLKQAAVIKTIHKRQENIAGVDVPYFEGAEFEPVLYNLLETPAWVDQTIFELQKLASAQIKIQVARDKLKALEKELREVSIRVNLFEKILIPRAESNIKKIKVFLGDQQLAAVAQAKVAKEKIVERRCASM